MWFSVQVIPGHQQGDGKRSGSHPEASHFRLGCLSGRSCRCLVAIHPFHLSQGQPCPGYRHNLPLGPWFPAPARLLPQLPGLCYVPGVKRVLWVFLLPSGPWPWCITTSRALAGAWASSHASRDLFAPQTLILRMATSGLIVLLLPDSDVETAYFSEDDRREGSPSSRTHQLRLNSLLGEKLFQRFGTPGAGELVSAVLYFSG